MENIVFECEPSRKVHCVVKCDWSDRSIHVVDFYGPTSLLHCFPKAVTHIFDHMAIVGSYLDWRWLVYARDGGIYEYNVKRFSPNGNGFMYVGDDERASGIDAEMCGLMAGLKRLNFY